MLSLVKNLFESYDFTGKATSVGFLFVPTDPSAKKAFWLVVPEENPNSIIDRQSEMFVACKAVCQDAAMDKNISMLILWETGGKLDHIALSQQVMTVEEDSYFFKKHVLYFSAQERDALRTAMNSKTFSDFIKEHVELKETFAAYKADPHSQSWQSLLYRTVMKLPFVQLSMDITDSLDLFTINSLNVAKAKDKSLADFDKIFFTLMADKTADDIKAADAQRILSELLPLLGGTSDGN